MQLLHQLFQKTRVSTETEAWDLGKQSMPEPALSGGRGSGGGGGGVLTLMSVM